MVFKVISFSFSSFLFFFNINFFRSEGFSGRGCYVVTSKSNSEETVCSCKHFTHFAVLVAYDGIPGVMILSSQLHHRVIQFRWFDKKFLISLYVICDTAYGQGRDYSANYHQSGIRLFHHRNTFDSYCVFLHYVSTTTMHTSKELILCLILNKDFGLKLHQYALKKNELMELIINNYGRNE